ncbi:hypothetical protein ILYODFUR_009995 [Ilyodon furcidens]|uniref:Uncharacterized protein n=1 Tax=Ilyodon furcidens TaxID=33524 RepID=A0ABV0VCQ0_9TELE
MLQSSLSVRFDHHHPTATDSAQLTLADGSLQHAQMHPNSHCAKGYNMQCLTPLNKCLLFLCVGESVCICAVFSSIVTFPSMTLKVCKCDSEKGNCMPMKCNQNDHELFLDMTFTLISICDSFMCNCLYESTASSLHV